MRRRRRIEELVNLLYQRGVRQEERGAQGLIWLHKSRYSIMRVPAITPTIKSTGLSGSQPRAADVPSNAIAAMMTPHSSKGRLRASLIDFACNISMNHNIEAGRAKVYSAMRELSHEDFRFA